MSIEIEIGVYEYRRRLRRRRMLIRTVLHTVLLVLGLNLFLSVLTAPEGTVGQFVEFALGTVMLSYVGASWIFWLLHTRTCDWCRNSTGRNWF